MTIWEIAFLFTYFSFLSMNNKFINNNGVNLLNTSKKTKVESQIEKLKQQEQEILKELSD